MLQVSKIQEYAKPKTSETLPQTKKRQWIVGNHKQRWILLLFPNPLLITKYLLYSFGETSYCVSSFQPLIPWIEWNRTGRKNTPQGEGRQLLLILLGGQQGKHAVGLQTEWELVLLSQIYADCLSRIEDWKPGKTVIDETNKTFGSASLMHHEFLGESMYHAQDDIFHIN